MATASDQGTTDKRSRTVALQGSIKAILVIGKDLERFHEVSPVGKVLERTFAWLQLISPATLFWGTRAYSRSIRPEERAAYEKNRSRSVEFYMLMWFAVLVAAGAASVLTFHGAGAGAWRISWLTGLLAAWRLLDIIQANINMHVFDGVRLSGVEKGENYVASQLRSTLISVWNYLEMIGWFAVLYMHPDSLKHGDGTQSIQPLAAVYFSAMAQLTVGFGDLVPANLCSRVLVIGQGLLGTLFIVFAIGRFASMLPPARSRSDQ